MTLEKQKTTCLSLEEQQAVLWTTLRWGSFHYPRPGTAQYKDDLNQAQRNAVRNTPWSITPSSPSPY